MEQLEAELKLYKSEHFEDRHITLNSLVQAYCSGDTSAKITKESVFTKVNCTSNLTWSHTSVGCHEVYPCFNAYAMLFISKTKVVLSCLESGQTILALINTSDKKLISTSPPFGQGKSRGIYQMDDQTLIIGSYDQAFKVKLIDDQFYVGKPIELGYVRYVNSIAKRDEDTFILGTSFWLMTFNSKTSA